MDTPFPPGAPPEMLYPAPDAEQARLHRMLAQHTPPAAPFDAALPAGSFNGTLAGLLDAHRIHAAHDPQVKLTFTFAF